MATALYYIVVNAGDTAPTAAQVVAGVSYTGATVLDAGSVAYTSAGTYDADSAPVTGASASTAYDQWWVAYDGTTYGTPVLGSVTTPISVPAASLTLTGYAPTVIAPQVVSVPAAALTLSAYAPVVQTPRGVSVPSATITLSGFAPLVVAPRTVSVPAASLTLTGYAPTISTAGAGTTVSVPAGALSLTGFAPSVATTATIGIPAAALTLTGFAPTVLDGTGISVAVPAASLSLTGYAPTVYALGTSTESVYYYPIRMFAASSSGAVDSTQDLANLRSLLPRQPQRAVNPDGTMTAEWYRFFDFFVNVFAGGPSAPTMADVQSAIEAALAELQTQGQTVALVAAQSQTNAEALAATVEVVQSNSLTGSGSIPAVSRTYLEP